MPKYNFKIIKTNGETYEGEKEAQDKVSLSRDIKKEGETVVSITEIKERETPSFLSGINILGSVSMVDKIAFAKNLGTMITAGLPMTRALSVMERQSKNKNFKKILGRLGDEITRGSSLSQAMVLFPKVFSTLFVSMVKAGEESGSITESLKSVGSQLEKSHFLYKKIRSAMIYPIIIVTVMIIITVLMLIFLVPTLTATFKDLKIELPLSTRSVIFVSDFMSNHYVATFSIVLALIVLFIGIGKTKKGKHFLDYILIHIPIIGTIVKETNSARTTRTLSSLLSSGVEFLSAIKITQEVIQNSYYKAVLEKASQSVGKGSPISAVFLEEEKLYPIFVGEMISIGEETGKLSLMLGNVAEFYENEVDQKTKDMSTIIEPFLMIFIGIAVGFFAISMLSPIYSLVDTI